MRVVEELVQLLMDYGGFPKVEAVEASRQLVIVVMTKVDVSVSPVPLLRAQSTSASYEVIER